MKRFFRLSFFFLTGWFLTACDTESCACLTFDLGIEVAIEDAAGNNLLDPATEGHFTRADIDMFYEIKGKLRTHASMSSGQLDNTDGFEIFSDEDQYILHLSSNPTAGNKVVTILRIKDRPDIRIVTKVVDRNGKKIEKVWYNDVLVWPGTDGRFSRRIGITLE